MNKSEILRHMGWDDDLIEAFADAFKDDIEPTAFETETGDGLCGSTEVHLRIESPVLVSASLIEAHAVS